MPNFVQNVPCRDQGLLLSFVLFYDGPNWPPKLCTKFEVDTFSHWLILKEKKQFLRAPLAQGYRDVVIQFSECFSQFQCSQRLPVHQHSMSFVLKDSSFGKYSIRDCFAETLKYHLSCSFSVIKFTVVSELVIKCGEKLQCLRNPDFVRFSQKIPRNPDETKNPYLVGKPSPGKPETWPITVK